METQEIWKDIPWYEGLYQASNLWGVKSFKFKKTKILLQSENWKINHLRVRLTKNKTSKIFQTHRLVASCFLWLDLYWWKDPKTSICVCHKDDNPKNNRVDNLFLWTIKDNNHDAMKKWRWILGKKWVTNLMFWKSGKDSPTSKIVYQIKNWNIIREYISAANASLITWIDRWSICSCARWVRKNAWWFKWSYSPVMG
jgi:hypothetical protein